MEGFQLSHLRNPHSIPGKRLAWESNTWQREGKEGGGGGGGGGAEEREGGYLNYKKKKNLFKHTPSP